MLYVNIVVVTVYGVSLMVKKGKECELLSISLYFPFAFVVSYVLYRAG